MPARNGIRVYVLRDMGELRSLRESGVPTPDGLPPWLDPQYEFVPPPHLAWGVLGEISSKAAHWAAFGILAPRMGKDGRPELRLKV